MRRGPRTDIKDIDGRKPIQLMGNEENSDLKKEFRELFTPPARIECLEYIPQTIYPNHRKPKTMIFMVCLLLVMQVIMALFVYPRLPWIVDLTEFCLAVLCLVSMTLASCMDPGYLKNSGVNF
jgi:hypothetical protein